MSTEKPHNEDAKRKPKPKKRQPVKKHDPQAERIAATFVIIGCVGAVAIGLLAYYHAETPLVWTTFLTPSRLFLLLFTFIGVAPTFRHCARGLDVFGGGALKYEPNTHKK